MPHAWNWLRAEAIDCYDEVQNKNFFPSRREGKFRPHESFFLFLFLSDPFNYYSGSEPSLMIFCVALRIVPFENFERGISRHL